MLIFIHSFITRQEHAEGTLPEGGWVRRLTGEGIAVKGTDAGRFMGCMCGRGGVCVGGGRGCVSVYGVGGGAGISLSLITLCPQQTLTSPGTVSSKRTSSTPGSPSTPICAKMDDQVLGYRTLAAIPTDKA
uniref:Putative adherens-junction anchoring domain-containing protein n=1 Tax=Callorhinchus milii TaxID=7868 RepID=A0A4W3GMH3_CALMI